MARGCDAVSDPERREPGGAAGGAESIGALLARLRLARGYSQLRLAEHLCAAAGLATISRHEVSRWEREDRLPGGFWLGWLAVVLEVPVARLEAAVAATRGQRTGSRSGRLWTSPAAAELLTLLDRGGQEVRELAHAWLAGPDEPPPVPRPGRPAGQWRQVTPAAGAGDLGARLAQLRRMDDLVGGPDLAGLVDAELRAAIRLLTGAGRVPGPGGLRLVAGYAHLAGWVHADAADPSASRRAYLVGLRAAAAAGDRPLAGHVLGSLSQLLLATGDLPGAVLLARTGLAGARGTGSALSEALLLHRVAFAAASAGERRAARAALTAAQRVADRVGDHPDPGAPDWLYWLDPVELSAMTGRCLAVLGRPLRAAKLLAAARDRSPGPRADAIYGGWLARAYLDLGEVEQACRVEARALRDAVRSGSVRAAVVLGSLAPALRRHRELTAVRGYRRLAATAAPLLPAGPAASRSARRIAWAG